MSEHLITANDEDLIETSLLEEGRELVNTAVKPSNGYITYLQRSAHNS